MLQVLRSELGLRGEVVGREALSALSPAWEDLCRRSLEDNVYYSPRYASALLNTVEAGKDVRFALAWHGAKLVAMLPFTASAFPVPPFRPAGRAWQSKHIYGCTPLLDAVRKAQAADALLNLLASTSGGEWVIPLLDTEGEACRALTAALARRRAGWAFMAPFRRAVLERDGSFDHHVGRHLQPGRRKDLARNRRRLEKLGELRHECHGSGKGLERAVAAFLDLERRGWKGRRGTALACAEATRDFAIRAFTGEEGTSVCRADVLSLSGVPVAVSLMVVAGRTGFTVKSAYDEAYRSYGAGLLLELEVIRCFLSEDWATRLDSATAGPHVLDGLWPGRANVADLAFSFAAHGPELRLRALAAADRAKRNMKAKAKAWLARARSGRKQAG